MALKHLLTATAILCSFGLCSDPLPPNLDPRVHYTMIEIVCSEGYFIQEYKVDTEDGYTLTMHRIPNGKRHPKIPRRGNHYQRVHEGYHPDFNECVRDSRAQEATGPPVLLVHGLLASSDFWVLQGPGYDLAFILADKGYDVWFANIRGNFYSRRHKSLRPSQPKFWDFSFHENAYYDLPKTIDYVLELTKHRKLIYVGHSMGTTIFFAMAAIKPEYNDKVHLFVGLAPVSRIRRISYDSSLLPFLLALMSLMKAYYRMGVYEFLPRNNLSNFLFKSFCSRPSLLQDFCYDAVFVLYGYSSKLVTRKSLPMCLSHSASGASVKTFLHYNQLLDEPNFRGYDHGPVENTRKYGHPHPPEYNLNKVKAPTVLFYSGEDFISRLDDVVQLKSQLPNVVEAHLVPQYNHVDFTWAYTARDEVYNKMVQMFAKFTNRSEGDGRPDLLT